MVYIYMLHTFYRTWRFSQFLNFESSLPKIHVIIWRAFMLAFTTLRFLYQWAGELSLPPCRRRRKINKTKLNWRKLKKKDDRIRNDVNKMQCVFFLSLIEHVVSVREGFCTNDFSIWMDVCACVLVCLCVWIKAETECAPNKFTMTEILFFF